MDNKKEQFPSTFTMDNFSSTATLATHEVKLPMGSSNTISEKSYDPYEHRNVEHPNSYFGALVHILKSSLGTGILAIPFAVAKVGLVTGAVGTILIGLLCTHTIHILVVASQEASRIKKVPSLGFSETAKAVFEIGPRPLRSWATFASIFVDIALCLTYYVGNAVYIVFVATNVQQLFVFYLPDWKDIEIWAYMIPIMCGLMLFTQVRELKYLVPFSFIANLTMIVAFGITLYYMFVDLVHKDISERDSFKSVEGIPKFFSTVIFAMEGIGTILPVENTMLKRNFLGWSGVLNTAMTVVICLYTVMGFLGYWAFGDGVHASITLDLDEKLIPAQIAKICISLTVFFTFMLQFFVPISINMKFLLPKIPEKWHNLTQISSRTILVFLITCVAASVPDLGVIIDLVGSIFFSTLGLLIPAVIETVLRWDKGLGAGKWVLWKNIFISVLAIFALVSGVYYAVLDLTGKKE